MLWEVVRLVIGNIDYDKLVDGFGVGCGFL